MEKVIKVDNLSKSYGSIEAVKSVSFEIYRGEMFGLVGPDGAGKTSTLRMLCGLINQQSGDISILGYELPKNSSRVKRRIGYLSQKFSLYGDLTVDENIEFFAEIHNVTDYHRRRNELLDFTNLEPFRKRLAEKLSGGMKQKLALACSLIHKPEILFLDEPTTGVDPVSRRDFWKILSELLQGGMTILMTTPYLDEAERCNRIALMNRGELIAVDTPAGVKGSMRKSATEIICSPIRKAHEILRDNSGIEVQLFGDRLILLTDQYADPVGFIEELTEKGIKIESRREVKPSLESVFIYLIKESSQK